MPISRLREEREREKKEGDRKARYPGQLEGDPHPTPQPFSRPRSRCMLTAITLGRYARL